MFVVLTFAAWLQKRGVEKERRFVMDLVHKQTEEERARVLEADSILHLSNLS